MEEILGDFICLLLLSILSAILLVYIMFNEPLMAGIYTFMFTMLLLTFLYKREKL